MQHFLIYANDLKDSDKAVTNRICDYLTGQNKRVSIYVDKEPIPDSVDCMIVLGGDGTILRAADDTRQRNIPMIGVNLGTLGYLAEIETAHLEEALKRLVDGDYEQENRMMLKGQVISEKECHLENRALNDIVISRSGPLQIIHFNVFVNGKFLNEYAADGIIVTTPTGSTGYNLSAGGPLVEPGARLLVLTPICPHSLNQRSIVLSSEDVIEVEVLPGRNGSHQMVEVHFDGSHTVELKTGDRVRIQKAEKQAEFVRLNQVSFLDVLHRKMHMS